MNNTLSVVLNSVAYRIETFVGSHLTDTIATFSNDAWAYHMSEPDREESIMTNTLTPHFTMPYGLGLLCLGFKSACSDHLSRCQHSHTQGVTRPKLLQHLGACRASTRLCQRHRHPPTNSISDSIVQQQQRRSVG